MIDTKKQYINTLNSKLVKNGNDTLYNVFSSFNQLSKDYSVFSDNIETNYSSYNYYECTKDEQDNFINEEVQFIECLVTNSIKEKRGAIWNFYEILNLMKDPDYASVNKKNRKALFSVTSTIRPVGDISYDNWNGFQVIDLDIKNRELSEKLKLILFNELSKYHWFLGICFSSSGNSLHIWTKISPIGDSHEHKQIEYYCNFCHKFSYVYIILLKYANEYGYTKENILSYMDNSMAKPQQGAYISSDNVPFLNTNFKTARLDANFEQAYNTSVSSLDWLSHPDLKNIFSKLKWFSDNTVQSPIDLEDIELDDRDITKSKGKKHYKHQQRWQLANTLVKLYGEDKGLDLLVNICSGTPYGELAGIARTAAIHDKPITQWAVKELNKNHGFKINIKQNINDRKDIEYVENVIKNNDNTINPINVLNEYTSTIKLHLNSNQYLSDIKDDIISNLGHMTLLEAGAGYGKTEMIKALSAKTLLILPYTSTIKSKVESSEVTKDWLIFYGDKKVTLEDILGDYNMTMTIDKFSRLNVYELDQANFEYIVVDESHLMFTSSFRDVMSPCIQRLANCKAKIILMSGTPTGEMLFFPGITHIKVEKDDVREKQFIIHFVPRKIEKTYEICLSIAKDIIDGKKILFPSNDGNLYFEQMTGIIQQIITERFRVNKIIKAFYYKKSNIGDKYMDSINIEKTIGDNDIVFGTSYLSVGVDICDKNRFSVYFNTVWIPQDIEQFANRLRNNNLYINLFLETEDSSGMPINYTTINELDLGINETEKMHLYNLIRSCNDMIERNNEESKYNPMILSMIGQNKFLKYDENECQYYIDETAYKLDVFEERYSDYAKQLPILQNMMKYYGYEVFTEKHDNKIPDAEVEVVENYLDSCKNKRCNYNTVQTFEFLDHITDSNIDIYKDLLKGSYDIFKDDKFKIDREEHNLYCTDIEILEKNIKIVLTLYKFYDCETIKEIFRYCVESKQNRINYAKLNRICDFVNIEYNRKRKRLDFPVLHFMNTAKQWVLDNKVTTSKAIQEWQINYAVKYANSIKNLIVNDNIILEDIYELVKKLWKVVIIQKQKNNQVYVTPFELLWTHKTEMNDIYGGSKYTKEFFLQELINGIEENNDTNIEVEDDTTEETFDIVNSDLEATSKVKLSDVQNDVDQIVQKTFDYSIYSKEHNANDRFMRKQFNTNILRDSVFGYDTSYEDSLNKPINVNTEQELFN